MRVPCRLRWTLVAAFAAHAGASVLTLGLVDVSMPASRVPEGFDAPRVADTEIDVEAPRDEIEPPTPEATPPASEMNPMSPTVVVSAGASARTKPDGVSVEAGGGESASSAPPAVGPVASSEGTTSPWSFSPTLPGAAGAHGPGEVLTTAVRDAVRASVEEDNKAQRRVALSPFDESDVDLGRIGTALAAMARERVRTSRTATVGSALLELVTNASGVVVSVRVVDASSARLEWDEVAAQLLGDAQGHPLHVPARARGIVLTIEVTSSLRTATGYAPTADPLAKLMRAVRNPLDTAIDGSSSTRRVIASRVVAVALR